MERSRTSRRRVLGAIAGIGLGAFSAGCSGAGSTNTTTADRTTGSAEPSTTATPTPTTTASQNESSTTGTPTNANERGAYTVGMYTELYFDPIGLCVEPGETVSFELESGVHSATAYAEPNQYALTRRIPENAPPWNTGEFDTVGAFRNVTFETEGTHDYYCIPHKQLGMVGRIVVGSPGGPATESANPDADLPSSERIVEAGSISYDEFTNE